MNVFPLRYSDRTLALPVKSVLNVMNNWMSLSKMTLLAKLLLRQAAGRGMSMTGRAHADKLMLTMRA
jgi:hypothetical protein